MTTLKKTYRLSLFLTIFVIGIRLITTAASAATDAQSFGSDPIPLIDMGSANYFGFEGGLYSNGLNTPPAAHQLAGLNHASQIIPRNTVGQPAANGKIVLLSIGMSNTAQEFCGNTQKCLAWTFGGQAKNDPQVNHSTLHIINGAKSGKASQEWISASSAQYDRIRDDVLAPPGLTEAQVQVVWLKIANAGVGGNPSLPDPDADAYLLQERLAQTVRALHTRYPNLKQVFVAARIYGGYAHNSLNPEPYAYESGFSAKWLIASQIDQMANGGHVVNTISGDLNYDNGAPWLAWGPYFWANGIEPRSDGLQWLPSDFDNDGTHPSKEGEEKVGTMLLDFFKGSPYTRCWFLANGECGVFSLDQQLFLPMINR